MLYVLSLLSLVTPSVGGGIPFPLPPKVRLVVAVPQPAEPSVPAAVLTPNGNGGK